jgi:hypothetical protein
MAWMGIRRETSAFIVSWRCRDALPRVLIVAVATEGDKTIKKVANDVFYRPKASEPLNSIRMSVPL